jgi:hypothetical protein
MTQASPHIWVPQRNPLWHPGNPLRAADGSPLPYTIDDVAGRPLDPQDYASLLAEIRDCAKFGKGAKIGRGVSACGPATPQAILGSSLIQWCRADHGITVATGVSQWDDLSGNGRHYTQATGAAQPAYGATAGPNSTPALTFDGVDDALKALTLTRPAPGTTPTWVWIVLKQVTWVNGRRIFSAGNSSSILTLLQSTPSPGLVTYNGLTPSVNSGLAVGAWGAVQTYFSNSTADYIQVDDASPTTGVSAGNNAAATSISLGSGVSALFGNIAVAEIVFADVLPSDAQLAKFSSYRQARYGI